jgi:hypothetical protein
VQTTKVHFQAGEAHIRSVDGLKEAMGAKHAGLEAASVRTLVLPGKDELRNPFGIPNSLHKFIL